MNSRLAVGSESTEKDSSHAKFRSRIQSENQAYDENRKTPYPETSTFRGYLDVRNGPKKGWRRRYFVLNNNFLLCGTTEHCQELERVIPLEGTNLSTTTTNTDTTFELRMRHRQLQFRAGSPQLARVWTEHIERASTLKIKDIYRFLKTLGTSESQNSKVVAAKHRVNGSDCAIKIVDKRSCDQKSLRSEIQILKQLDHKSIVKLLDLFENKKYLYIVMEKCEGGELFDQIANLDGERYTEEDCCHVMHQIADGVKYMHAKGIVHRDLKPENILCVRKNSIKTIKIADFGISKMVKENELMKTMVGTLSYTAPEILEGRKYDYRVDYWSIGVIFFILLVGYPPFYGDNDVEIQTSIKRDPVEYDDEDWGHVSPETLELVKGLLDKDPRKRKTVEDVLQITWKVSSTKGAFQIAHTKFKQTVQKRKMHRQSMGLFEKSSDMMNRIYKPEVKDEMSLLNKPGSKPEVHAYQQGSKTAEFLELQLHPRSRVSFDEGADEDENKKH